MADAPAAITVVTAADIAARGYRSLAEILADVVGFNEVSDRNEEIVGTRGVFASTTNKTLFLINGHRMNDLLLGRYNVDQYLGLDAVERIELIRGPVGPLYGTGALVGVVNIITMKGRRLDGTRLKYQGGPHAHEASLTWGKLVGGYDLLFNFTFRDQKGQEIARPAREDFVDPMAQPPQVQMPGKIYWRRYPENFSGLLDVRTQDSSLTIRGAHFQRVTPRGANGSFYDYDQERLSPTFTENDLYFDYRKSWTFGSPSAGKLTFNPSLHHFSYYEQSYLTFGSNRRPPLGSRSGKLAEMNDYQVKLTYDRTFLDAVGATAGFEGLLASMYRTDRLSIVGQGQEQVVEVVPQGYAPTGGWLVAGLFAQAVYSPLRSLTITAGARFDTFTFEDKIDAKLTPRLGLVYRPRDEWAFKLLYGESYLAPQYGHRLSKDPEFVGNRQLGPETFRGGDAIVMYEGRAVAVTADLYFNEVAGLINQVPNAPPAMGGTYQNTGSSLYLGLDVTAEARLASWARFSAGYSLIRSAQAHEPGASGPLVDAGDIIAVPRHTFRYGLRIAPLAALTCSLWGRYTTRTKVSDSVLNPLLPALTTIPPVFLLDGSIAYTWSALTLQLVATNLTDTYYERGGAVPRPLARNGFMIEGAVAYRF